MGRSPCCSKVGLRRGPWSTNEDTLLSDYIQLHGEGHWRSLPNNAGLLRCGKSCRLRWMNYLKPGIKRGNITQDEEDLIVRLHALLGNRWSLIAGRLPGRTDNEIKNYWNTYLFKKLKNAGIQSKHFPKPKPKPKPKPTTAKKKKNKVATAAAPAVAGEATNNSTKVYLPKPIRLSSRTKSNDSFTTSGATSSSDGAGEKVAAESYVPVLWPPLFEMEDGGGEGFMGILPLLTNHSAGGDVDMLDQVYDEYLQLLQFDH